MKRTYTLDSSAAAYGSVDIGRLVCVLSIETDGVDVAIITKPFRIGF